MAGEMYLGKSKYDGNIRRVTLIKAVADKLEMRDGDILTYWEIGNDIVIRKEKRDPKDAPQMMDFIPDGTPLEEVQMIMKAAFDIADYFNSNRSEPTGVEMIEIAEKASANFPEDYSKEKKGEMLQISINLAKNLISKTRIVPMADDKPEE